MLTAPAPREDEFSWRTRWERVPPDLQALPTHRLGRRVANAVADLLEARGVAVSLSRVEARRIPSSGPDNEGWLVLLLDLVTVGWQPQGLDRFYLVTHAVTAASSLSKDWQKTGR